MKKIFISLVIITILLIISAISVLATTNKPIIKEIDANKINTPEECIEILEKIANNNPTNEVDINQNYENEQKVKQRLVELSNNTVSLQTNKILKKEEILEQIEDKIAAYDIVKMTFELENDKSKAQEYQKYIEEANELIEEVKNNKELTKIQDKLTKLK